MEKTYRQKRRSLSRDPSPENRRHHDSDYDMNSPRRQRHGYRRRSPSESRDETRRARHPGGLRDNYIDTSNREGSQIAGRYHSPTAQDRPKHKSRRHRHRSRSASPRSHRHTDERSASPPRRSRKPLPSQEESYRDQDPGAHGAIEKSVEKQKPNFKPTGLLAAETNRVSTGNSKDSKSIILKYHEPPEARKAPSSERWIMYVFKGASQDPLETFNLHTRSCWLLGREAAVADIITEHPSCSKQHAVLQFRYVVKKDEWGEKKDKVGLYILDLESSNGTFLNAERIDAARYVQCMNGDVVKFGDSSREYVILLPPKD